MWGCCDLVNAVNVYHLLARFSSPTPSLQLSSVSDESLVLLYSSHSDEVELMATFTPADVIRAVRLRSRREGEVQTPAGSCYGPAASFFLRASHQLNWLYLFAFCCNSKNFQ